ncbi:hypothetical protein PENARI_c017G09838 [Penicillium arizonense]|uniref:C2H2-type domain-containing protein n=1 Tax=Penicillium arizonense TaxID=1835702 RepID=A0A1F5LBS4_PENAI|nr:hypothetical protein PENARI_c017G09838 [Penicillium arizonense]OGE50389.1 hypothetical protein PENARI_c017G09838 [Penicillium arizonense]
MPLTHDWKRIFTYFPSCCGFCNGRMSTWDERANHLTFHFRNGRNMAHWIGDQELPPEIALKSRIDYHLIFWIRISNVSATDRVVNGHLSQLISPAIFFEAEDSQHVSPEAAEVDPEHVQ